MFDMFNIFNMFNMFNMFNKPYLLSSFATSITAEDRPGRRERREAADRRARQHHPGADHDHRRHFEPRHSEGEGAQRRAARVPPRFLLRVLVVLGISKWSYC